MGEPAVPRFMSDLSEEEKRHILEKRNEQTNPRKRTLTTRRGSRIRYLRGHEEQQQHQHEAPEKTGPPKYERTGQLDHDRVGQLEDDKTGRSEDDRTGQLAGEDAVSTRVEKTPPRFPASDDALDSPITDDRATENLVDASSSTSADYPARENTPSPPTPLSDDAVDKTVDRIPLKHVHCDICDRDIPFLMGIGPLHHAIALHGQPPEGLLSLPSEPDFHYDQCHVCQLYFDKFSYRYHRCEAGAAAVVEAIVA